MLAILTQDSYMANDKKENVLVNTDNILYATADGSRTRVHLLDNTILYVEESIESICIIACERGELQMIDCMIDTNQTEYALEEYHKGKFYKQIEIFYLFQNALNYAHESNLSEYVIRAIYYDKNGNEVDSEVLFSSNFDRGKGE